MKSALKFKRRTGAGLYPRHEINITPLMDVLLVLLVIFMVTAPMVSTGVSVDLPEGSSRHSLPDVQPVVIALDKTGNLFLNEQKIAPDQLVWALKKMPQESTGRIYIRADKNLTYASIMNLMSLLISSGYTKISLVTEGKEPSPQGKSEPATGNIRPLFPWVLKEGLARNTERSQGTYGQSVWCDTGDSGKNSLYSAVTQMLPSERSLGKRFTVQN